jgi:hypothetical protein
VKKGIALYKEIAAMKDMEAMEGLAQRIRDADTCGGIFILSEFFMAAFNAGAEAQKLDTVNDELKRNES